MHNVFYVSKCWELKHLSEYHSVTTGVGLEFNINKSISILFKNHYSKLYAISTGGEGVVVAATVTIVDGRTFISRA